MPPQLALMGCVLFIVWLFVTDRRRHEKMSAALWIPLIWMLIIATRSPSAWLNIFAGKAGGDEDKSYSTLVFVALFLSGFWVLRRRRVNWQIISSNNMWLFVYLFYVANSVIWSDQPVTSGILWIKAAGSILMVLILLSEDDPVAAVKSTLLRSSYILVVLSCVTVKYFPDLSRTYDQWTYEPIIVGVCTDKNSFGATLIVCALAQVWSFLDLQRGKTLDRKNILAHLPVLAMALWLLVESHCATAFACVIAGSGILLGMRLPTIRSLVQRPRFSVLIIVPLVLVCVSLVSSFSGGLVKMLGRDSTFTGRTGIWKATLQADVNPLIGVGYCSFWHGERARVISEGLGFFYNLQEAHNGYLEVYLDGGLLRLFLLIIALAFGAARIMSQLADGDSFPPLRLAFLTVALIYNVTESAFDGLNPIWFVLLLALVECPSHHNRGADAQDEFRKTGVAQLELCEEFSDSSDSSAWR